MAQQTVRARLDVTIRRVDDNAEHEVIDAVQITEALIDEYLCAATWYMDSADGEAELKFDVHKVEIVNSDFVEASNDD